jgi:Spy/CpxP family protein refolding chaperone
MIMASKSLLVMMCLALSWTALAAQDDDGPPMPRERMQQRIEDVRKMKLIDILELQDSQVEKFFQLYNSLHGTVLQRKRDMDEKAETLKRMSRDASSSLQPQIDALQSATHAFHEAIEQRNAKIKDVLSPQQHAKYLVFEAKFPEELAKMLAKRAKKRE